MKASSSGCGNKIKENVQKSNKRIGMQIFLHLGIIWSYLQGM